MKPLQNEWPQQFHIPHCLCCHCLAQAIPDWCSRCESTTLTSVSTAQVCMDSYKECTECHPSLMRSDRLASMLHLQVLLALLAAYHQSTAEANTSQAHAKSGVYRQHIWIWERIFANIFHFGGLGTQHIALLFKTAMAGKLMSLAQHKQVEMETHRRWVGATLAC